MRYLVYGIVLERASALRGLPRGVEGGQVALVAADGLAAAVSAVSEACALPPTAERLRAYADVITALHNLCTVLPLRYGCVLGGEAAAAGLLRERREEFLASLREVDGCAEMSVHVLLGEPGEPGPVAWETAPYPTGVAYLAARKASYAAQDSARSRAAAVAEQVRGAFGGLAAKCTVRSGPRRGDGLVSLGFLVRKEHCEAFRGVFRSLQDALPQKLLLTGPWPPHSFAGSAKPPGLNGRREAAR